MKKLTGVLAGLLVAGAGVAFAQEVMGPPPVLEIQREFLKPGKAGNAHDRTESQFVQAFTAAKWPTYYLGVKSLSGRSRALFMMGYPSFAAWEKDNKAVEKNATLSAAVDRAQAADGELQTEFEQSLFVYDPEHSLRAASVVHSRYFEIHQFKVKPGHTQEWYELLKLYHDGYEKASPAVNWALYESYYGQENGGIFLAIVRMTSLAEVDQGMRDDKKFVEVMGKDGMKKMEELEASCVEWSQTNLFEFSPKISYPDPEWIKADPFWKPKVSAPAAKPAQ